MKTEKNLYASLRLDLSIGATFIKGFNRPVRNCWHFSSDGNFAFAIFESESDFKAAMNRLALLTLRYKVIILAFCLMDNHIHLILYGSKAECEAFAKEFLNLTAHYNSVRHHSGEGTSSIPVSHQAIEDEEYYRANCETIKANRRYLRNALSEMGFRVLPSSTNFLFARHPDIKGIDLYNELKKRKILVRHFDGERIRAYNRIAIGTREQVDKLIEEIAAILKDNSVKPEE